MSAEAPALMLDAATIKAIARAVILEQGISGPAPVLTLAEACDFVRVGSKSALERWLKKFAPNARCGFGRYTRTALAKGRDVEARQFARQRQPRQHPAPVAHVGDDQERLSA